MREQTFSIFIIGVPQKYRGHHLEERLIKEEKFFCRIDGIDASLMSSFEYNSKTFPKISKKLLGRHLTKGELCCALAHEDAYNKFLETKTEWALILEDDCELSQEFEISTLLSQINGNTPLIVQLYGAASYLEQVKRWPWMGIAISREVENSELVMIKRSWELPDGTYGYLINRAAAELAVNSMKVSRHVSTADWPAQWRGEIRFMVSRHSFLSTKENDSLIDFERRLARSTKLLQVKRDFPKVNISARVHRKVNPFADFNLSLFTLWGRDMIYLQVRRIKNLVFRCIIHFRRMFTSLTRLRIKQN